MMKDYKKLLWNHIKLKELISHNLLLLLGLVFYDKEEVDLTTWNKWHMLNL